MPQYLPYSRGFDTSGHRRRHTERFVNTGEIVPYKIESKRVAMVLNLFGECIGQSRKTTNGHRVVRLCRST